MERNAQKNGGKSEVFVYFSRALSLLFAASNQREKNQHYCIAICIWFVKLGPLWIFTQNEVHLLISTVLSPPVFLSLGVVLSIIIGRANILSNDISTVHVFIFHEISEFYFSRFSTDPSLAHSMCLGYVCVFAGGTWLKLTSLDLIKTFNLKQCV